MQYTLIFALLPAIVFAVHPDRHVRTAQGGEQLSIAVQSDGGIVKVEDGKELNLPSAKTREEIEEINKKLHKGNDNLKKAQKHAMGEDEDKKLEEIPKVEPKIPKLEPHIPKEHEDEKKLESIPKIEPKPKEEEMEALVKEAKPHAEAFAAPAGAHEVKLHETREVAPSHPALAKRKKKVGEGVAMLEVDEPEEPGESWKSAFFFFGSLVLFVVLAMALIGFFYFNRDQAEKNWRCRFCWTEGDPFKSGVPQRVLFDFRFRRKDCNAFRSRPSESGRPERQGSCCSVRCGRRPPEPNLNQLACHGAKSPT